MSTQASLHELSKALFDEYEIGRVTSITPLPLPDRREAKDDDFASLRTLPATAWQVEAGSRLYCLKEHRAGKSGTRIAFETAFQSSANKQAYALIPLLIFNAAGGSDFLWQERRYWLTDYVHCDRQFRWYEPSWTLTEAIAAAAALSSFHLFTSELGVELQLGQDCDVDAASKGAQIARSGDNVGNNQSVLPSLLTWLEQSIDQYRKGHSKDASLLSELEQTQRIAVQALKVIAAAEASIGELRVLVHGDYHPGNLLYESEQVRAIVDYEHLHFEDPIFDLAYAARFFCAGRGSDPAAFELGWLEKMVVTYKSGFGAYIADRCSMVLLPYLQVTSALLVVWLLGKFVTADPKLRIVYETLLKNELRIIQRLQFY